MIPEIIFFPILNHCWFEWCQQFLSSILLNLTTCILVFRVLYR
jgi:hypothetical protein